MASNGERRDPAREYLERYAGLRPILAQIMPILLLTLAASILAGFLFLEMKRSLELLPGLLALIPAVMGTRGSIYGAFGSRLATGLHLGIIEPRFVRNPNVNNAIATALINSVTISFVIAVFAYVILLLLARQTIPLWALVVISLTAGVISGLILLGIVMLITFKGFKRGVDPDNLVGPVVTVTGDIFSILALLLSAEMVLVMLE